MIEELRWLVVKFESQHHLLFCFICPKTITSLIYVLTSRTFILLSINHNLDRFQCRLLINITTFIGLIYHVGYLLSPTNPPRLNVSLIVQMKRALIGVSPPQFPFQDLF